jgi:hypothetical protein
VNGFTGVTALRSRPGTPAESSLAESVTALRNRSKHRVRTAFGGFDLADLDSVTDGAVVCLAATDPELLGTLRSESIWNRTSTTHPGHPPHVLVVPPGEQAPGPLPASCIRAPINDAEDPALVTGALAALLERGATVVLNRVDQWDLGALRCLSEDLERIFGVVAGTNAYVSRNAAQGFGRHWDDHDVVVVQVEGRKMWEVFEPTALSPVRPVVSDQAAGRAAWSGVLGPGDVLVVPRGWAHRTIAFDELSVHYTIGLHRLTWLDTLRASVEPDDISMDGARRWLGHIAVDAAETARRTQAALWSRIPARSRGALADADDALSRRLAETPWPSDGRLVVANSAPAALFDDSTTDLDGSGTGQAVATLRWSDQSVELTEDDVEEFVAALATVEASGWSRSPTAGLEPTSPLARRLLVRGLARWEPDLDSVGAAA